MKIHLLSSELTNHDTHISVASRDDVFMYSLPNHGGIRIRWWVGNTSYSSYRGTNTKPINKTITNSLWAILFIKDGAVQFFIMHSNLQK